MTFTVEELDYLDNKADADARRERQEGASTEAPSKAAPKGRNGRNPRSRATEAAPY
jgi:hypothetical protein